MTKETHSFSAFFPHLKKELMVKLGVWGNEIDETQLL